MNTTDTSLYQPNIILTNNQLAIIVIFSIFACLVCIYAVFFFGRNLQSNAVLRDTLVEAFKKQEYDKLHYELLNKAAYEGPLDREKNPPPEGYGNDFRPLWFPIDFPRPVEPYFEDQNEREKWEKQKEINSAWEIKEKEIFDNKCKEAEAKASEIAEKRVPKYIDVSLLGGGFSFLLEFSTVIVIIFTLLILGILGNLDGNEVSTILASIAGYVLGKATSSRGGSESTSELSSSMQIKKEK